MLDELPELAHIPLVSETIKGFHDILPRIVELCKNAFIDPLTGLLNRGALILQEHKHDQTLPANIIVAHVDVAEFKAVNATYTDAGGDFALSMLAKSFKIIDKHIESRSFRKGGDEFVVIIPAENLGLFLAMCEKQLSSILCEFGKDTFSISCNVGYVKPTSSMATLRDLMKCAEHACKVQKYRGTSVPVEWTQELSESKPFSERLKCGSCKATATILVEIADKKIDCLTRCPNCARQYDSPLGEDGPAASRSILA